MGRAGRVFPWEHPWEHRTRFPGMTGTPDPPAQNRATFTAATRSIYNWDSGSGAGDDFWLPASWLTSAVLIAEGA